MRIAPLALLLALAPGCGKKSDDSGVPAGSTGTPAATPVGTPTTGEPVPNVVLTEGPVITCPNPGARLVGHFDRRTAPHPPADGSFTWGGGVVSEDFDGDGVLDLVIAAQAGLQLYLTRPGATAAEVSFESVDGAFGTIELDYAVTGTPVDIDADGDVDLVVARWDRPNRLLLNDGTGTFSDATPAAWAARSLKSQTASLGDMDGDGDLDVFFGSYGDKPATFDDPLMPPADPAELYRNDGGSWVDVSDQLPQEAHDGYTFASGWWQLWGDERPDLVIANDFGKVRPSLIVRNSIAGVFSADTTFHPGWEDMGMGVGDVNGDSQPDFLFSSWRKLSVLASGVGYGLPGTWVEVADSWGVQADPVNRNQVYGWGAEWGDLDNDADLDALVNWSYWSAYTEAGDPLTQVDALYEQTGVLSFTQTGGEARWSVNDGSRSRGLVLADLNDDGWLDVVKGLPEADSLLYLSRCGAESWLRVRLRQNGDNPHAIGARVRIITSSLTQTRWIQAGSSGMYGAGPLEAHFGTYVNDLIDTIEVTWPDGKVHSFEAVGARRTVTITRNNAG